MLTDQSKGFQKLIFDRIYQIRDEILNRDPEYRELGKIASELLDRLLAKLPPGGPGAVGPVRLRTDEPNLPPG